MRASHRRPVARAARPLALAFIAAFGLSGCTNAHPAGAPISDQLTISEYRFVPREISWATGAQITLRVANKGKLTHNFSLSEVPIDVDFPPGQTRNVIFVVPASVNGIEFFCKFHRDRGMRGVLRGVTLPDLTSTSR